MLEESGEVEAVDAVLALLDAAEDDAVVRLLRATHESRLGRTDSSEAWFRHAIASAESPSVAAEAAYRLARDLVRRERADAVELLEPYIVDSALPSEQRALIGSLLAQAYLVARRPEEAHAIVAEALALRDELSPAAQAHVLVRAAYVELNAGEPEKAAGYARAAAEIAHANDRYVIALGAYSVLSTLAYERVGPSEALPYVERFWDCAVRVGDLEFQLHAMTNAYDAFVERGDCEAIERLDRDLAEFDFYYSGSGSPRDSVLSSRALIAAWSGAFLHAYELLAPSGADLGDADREALRHAELALYAAAAGMHAEARGAIGAVERALANIERASVYAARAGVIARLAAAIAGLPFAVPREVRGAERIVPLENAVEVVVRHSRGLTGGAEVLAALDELRAREWGGFAKLLAALPVAA
jgi:tetratricopeptide (TPR) repeat protein